MCVGLGGGCYLKGVSVDSNCNKYQGLFFPASVHLLLILESLLFGFLLNKKAC